MNAAEKILVLAAAVLAACERPVRQPPPPPVVLVGQPVVRDVETYLEAVGTTSASDFVEIRARVNGVLRATEFVAGSRVEAGQLLFLLESDSFELAVADAEATLAIARAELQRAEADLARVELAVQSKAVSEMEVGLRRADRDKAAASARAAEVALAAARLDLGYTRISSPIAGRASRAQASVGNLVGPGGQTAVLTTIAAMQPSSVYFEVPERLVVESLGEAAGTGDLGTGARRFPIRMQLEGETGYRHEGYIDFAENRVDSTTGTLRVRGRFENAEGRIMPGLFARIRIPAGRIAGAVLVEETAIGTDLGGKYVLVVGSGNVVERRRVVLGGTDGGLRVVLSGLEAGATYVVDGIVKARPGLPVTPQPAERAAGESGR